MAFQPGVLRVVAYKSDKPWATGEVKTAGQPARLELEADRGVISADGKDLCFVTVTVTDKDGLPVPRADNQIRFEIEGPGEIVGADNGDSTSFEPLESPGSRAFGGKCLVVVRGKAGQTGSIRLTAVAEGLHSATMTVKTVREP